MCQRKRPGGRPAGDRPGRSVRMPPRRRASLPGERVPPRAERMTGILRGPLPGHRAHPDQHLRLRSCGPYGTVSVSAAVVSSG
ncbi:hypothetical protein TPA0910_38650 [Streptomyces hygroscopicus subsp. sporocinereus]|uniref:Uncharacterized protein n=1 Tax=Streptomyces hygroscopicus TaxID=1912 RepID=A0ABQ3U1E3_STRHY|nr:hypothetical protein TPA0910_38650 [Streptomyces hygroscopicus]